MDLAPFMRRQTNNYRYFMRFPDKTVMDKLTGNPAVIVPLSNEEKNNYKQLCQNYWDSMEELNIVCEGRGGSGHFMMMLMNNPDRTDLPNDIWEKGLECYNAREKMNKFRMNRLNAGDREFIEIRKPILGF